MVGGEREFQAAALPMEEPIDEANSDKNALTTAGSSMGGVRENVAARPCRIFRLRIKRKKRAASSSC